MIELKIYGGIDFDSQAMIEELKCLPPEIRQGVRTIFLTSFVYDLDGNPLPFVKVILPHGYISDQDKEIIATCLKFAEVQCAVRFPQRRYHRWHKGSETAFVPESSTSPA